MSQFIFTTLTLLFLGLLQVNTSAGVPCRNSFLWPFNSTSIWNTPIGSDAFMSPSNLYNSKTSLRQPPTNFHNDQDWIILAHDSDPETPWIDDSGHFPGGCVQIAKNATESITHFPSSLVVDCTPNNNAAAILLPDGRSLIQTQPLYRPFPGSPIIAWYHTGAPQAYPWKIDVRGDGALGAHGGSGLSSIGGTIRLGELLQNTTINHALKIELWSHPYYFGGTPALKNSTSANGGRNQYVWPATGSDSGSNIPGEQGGLYNGTDRVVAPGALLALPRNIATELQLQTKLGEKFKQVLTDFGAYIVDDTGSEAGGAAFCAEPGVVLEVERAYGVSFNITNPVSKGKSAKDDAVYNDLLLLFQNLHVVTNNFPTSIGGGGVVPLNLATVPPFCKEKPNQGVLHKVATCVECQEFWCQGYVFESDDVENNYLIGVDVKTWGCANVLKGMTRVRNSKTGAIYAVQTNAVIGSWKLEKT